MTEVRNWARAWRRSAKRWKYIGDQTHEEIKKLESHRDNERLQAKRIRDTASRVVIEKTDQANVLSARLSLAVAALEKIADPRKRDHNEPDEYTTSACLMNIADEALKEIKEGRLECPA